MKHALLSALTIFLLAGCGSLLPQERKESTSVKGTENLGSQQTERFTRATQGERTPVPVVTPAPNLTVSGTNNHVDVSYSPPAPAQRPTVSSGFTETVEYDQKGKQSAASTEDMSSFLGVTIPLGVKLALLAAGIFALIYAFRAVKNSSAAAKAAFETGDGVLAQHINRLRDRAIKTTDPKEAAAYMTDIASLESERGRLSHLNIAVTRSPVV